MIKISLLSERHGRLSAVYPEHVLLELSKLGELSGMLKKEDILTGKYKDTDYIFSTWGMPSFTSEEICEYLPSLKAVFYAAGSVQGFAKEFLEAGVRVFSAWGANGVPVAEFTVAEILLSNKGFFRLSAMMKQGKTKDAKKAQSDYPGNYGARVGLLGVGMIGSMVARRLAEYNFELLAYDPFCTSEKAESLGVRLTSLEEIFATCKVVSNHLANNKDTEGLLGYDLFMSMEPYATFINTGRGAQVREAELAKVLYERHDLTALLDVTYPEPPEEGHPFYSLGNCILTPHIAGSIGDEVVRMSEYMLEEFKLLLGSMPLRYEVSLGMLETMA